MRQSISTISPVTTSSTSSLLSSTTSSAIRSTASFYQAPAYRDRVYIIKDIIIKLIEHGELNQTALITFCGLNLTKHKGIIDAMEKNKLIAKRVINIGKRSSILYTPTKKGIDFCSQILEIYENMFPRDAFENKRSDQKQL